MGEDWGVVIRQWENSKSGRGRGRFKKEPLGDGKGGEKLKRPEKLASSRRFTSSYITKKDPEKDGKRFSTRPPGGIEAWAGLREREGRTPITTLGEERTTKRVKRGVRKGSNPHFLTREGKWVIFAGELSYMGGGGKWSASQKQQTREERRDNVTEKETLKIKTNFRRSGKLSVWKKQ